MELYHADLEFRKYLEGLFFSFLSSEYIDFISLVWFLVYVKSTSVFELHGLLVWPLWLSWLVSDFYSLRKYGSINKEKKIWCQENIVFYGLSVNKKLHGIMQIKQGAF